MADGGQQQQPGAASGTPPWLGDTALRFAVVAALIFVGWLVAVAVIDAALKPVMLGRGLLIPVPTILVGVIGGALAAGLVGLLVGPVLLSTGYLLLREWLGEPLSDEVQA